MSKQVLKMNYGLCYSFTEFVSLLTLSLCFYIQNNLIYEETGVQLLIQYSINSCKVLKIHFRLSSKSFLYCYTQIQCSTIDIIRLSKRINKSKEQSEPFLPEGQWQSRATWSQFRAARRILSFSLFSFLKISYMTSTWRGHENSDRSAVAVIWRKKLTIHTGHE